MIYSEFKDKNLSLLGFGAMRLPLLDEKTGEIDQAQVNEMVSYALEHGVNYFDTAYPYHNGMSETSLGEALSKHDRNSFYLASKFPGHTMAPSYDTPAIFEEQLKKCQVEYFDFYLVHNVNELSLPTYEDERWGIIDYLVKQKELGRIKHLGFSAHALVDCMEYFLEKYGKYMEFCQIQLNYLDWTLQDAAGKVALLDKYNIPVWVMEPLRGGKLVNLNDDAAAKMKEAYPDITSVQFGFRFLQGIDSVKVILSGMSNMEQMIDNIKTFEVRNPLSEEERAFLLDLAEGMKNALPCTSCRYCVKGCPKKLDIPKLINLYNDARFSPSSMMVGVTIDGLKDEERPAQCISCGKCAKVCPQKIDIPTAMSEFAAILEKTPHWADICKKIAEEKNK